MLGIGPVLAPEGLREPSAVDPGARARRRPGGPCRLRPDRPRGTARLSARRAQPAPVAAAAASRRRADPGHDPRGGRRDGRHHHPGMDRGVDTGPIVAAERVELTGHETAPELESRLAALAADLLARTVELMGGRRQLVARPQDDAAATSTRPLRPADGHLDPTRPAVELERAGVPAWSRDPPAPFVERTSWDGWIDVRSHGQRDRRPRPTSPATSWPRATGWHSRPSTVACFSDRSSSKDGGPSMSRRFGVARAGLVGAGVA